MAGGSFRSFKLYTFADNHDVERIYTRLQNKAQFVPLHILLYTLPGIPSLYYGSEFGIEGVKLRGGSDDAIRPALRLEELKPNACTELITALGAIRKACPALSWGEYRELLLQNRVYAFARELPGERVIVAVNNDENPAPVRIPCENGDYVGALGGGRVEVREGWLCATLPACGGEIWRPAQAEGERPAVDLAALTESLRQPEVEKKDEPQERPVVDKPFEQMSIEELQSAILAKMAKNGPVTEQMRRSVLENTHQGSLLNWVRSFR